MQISKEFHSKLDAKKDVLSIEDLKKEEKQILGELYTKYLDRVGKVVVLFMSLFILLDCYKLALESFF